MNLYLSHFGLDAPAFSIVPDPKGMYMSDGHQQAVVHLLYALRQSGGFVQLTGEVGVGKTTVSRYILSNLPPDVDVALLLNPCINALEMLAAICDELGLAYRAGARQKTLLDKLNTYLLAAHAKGRYTVLMIDEAQNLSVEVLEQIRLLTNLETATDKLLQIILIGQPELNKTLQRHDLRQLSQRIIGRFKLAALSPAETRAYIAHRLSINGVQRAIFSRAALRQVQRLSAGIPRLINLLCDRALMGAYAHNKPKVTAHFIKHAGQQVLLDARPRPVWQPWRKLRVATMLLIAVILGIGGGVALSQSEAWRQARDARLSAASSPTPPAEYATEPATPRAPPSPIARSAAATTAKLTDGKFAAATTANQLTANQPTERQRPTPRATAQFDLTYRLGIPQKQPLKQP